MWGRIEELRYGIRKEGGCLEGWKDYFKFMKRLKGKLGFK